MDYIQFATSPYPELSNNDISLSVIHYHVKGQISALTLARTGLRWRRGRGESLPMSSLLSYVPASTHLFEFLFEFLFLTIH